MPSWKSCALLLAVAVLARGVAVVDGSLRNVLFPASTLPPSSTIGFEVKNVIRTPDLYQECDEGEYFDPSGQCRFDWGKSASIGTPPTPSTVSTPTVKERLGLQARCPEGEAFRDGRCQREASTSRPSLAARCPAGEAVRDGRCQREPSASRPGLAARCPEGEAFRDGRCQREASTSRPGLAARCPAGEAFRDGRCQREASTSRPGLAARCPEGEAFKDGRCQREASTPRTTTPRWRSTPTTTRRSRSRRRLPTPLTCKRGWVVIEERCVMVVVLPAPCTEREMFDGERCRPRSRSKRTPVKKEPRCATGEAFVEGNCQATTTTTTTNVTCAEGMELRGGRCRKLKKVPAQDVAVKKLLVNLQSKPGCAPGEAFDAGGRCRETWLEAGQEVRDSISNQDSGTGAAQLAFASVMVALLARAL